MKLRVGLVGLGDAWEGRHRPALRALSDRFDVRAVCAPVARLAKIVADEFGAAQVDGFRALVARKDLDAVLVFSSGFYGSLPILAACQAGKSVYTATEFEDDDGLLERIRRSAQESGVAFMAEFPNRQAPATLRLKELIATHLGRPRLLFCHQRHVSAAANGASWVRRALINAVDWCCYVAAESPRSIVGVAPHCEPSREDDYFMLSLQFSGSGPIAQISCGHYISPLWKEASSFRTPAEMQVVCERGVAFLDLPHSLIWFDDAGRHQETLDSERPMGEQSLLSFYRLVTSLVHSTQGLEDAIRAHYIVQRARESCTTGQRLPL